ncbi:MFS general substrate transporter [Podospora conica]|nr:MFS general substrate transporter [Schizothecium conicum]
MGSSLQVEKGQLHVAEKGESVSASIDEPSWTPEAEKRLVRKIDLCLIPILWTMNLLSWMDRANLGNANIAGLTQDLSLSSYQYSTAVGAFYYGTIAWTPIANLIVARTRPSIYLPAIMGLWGILTAATSMVNSYAVLVVTRVLLGMLEAGLTPAVIYLLSCWYLPSETGKRSALFLTSAMMGGIFSGLIAGGLMATLDGAHGLRGWRWLFIVEGAITIVMAAVAAFVLPDFPGTSKRLSSAEREIAVQRLARVGTTTQGDSSEKLTIATTVLTSLKDWKTYAVACGTATSSGAMTLIYFFPILVKGLGYTDAIMAQYMTAPIWAVALVLTVAAGYAADRVPRHRGLVVAGGAALAAAMAIITCFVHDFKARYVLLCIMSSGSWINYSQILSYMADMFGSLHPQVRAFSIGCISTAAQAGMIYGPYFFPAENAPKHLLGFGMVSVVAALCACFYVGIYFGRRYELRSRSD